MTTIEEASSSMSRSESAALELWDMITLATPAPPENAFVKRQQNRTLHHPKLPQPEPEESLRKRLSQVLLSSKGDGEASSPTSTLQFPSSSSTLYPSLDDAEFYQPNDGIVLCQEMQEPQVVAQEVQEPQVEEQDTTLPHSMTEMTTHSDQHSFVVCADTQLGMTNKNREWETELEYSRQAVRVLNEMQPKPSFCCVCGDLVDMEYSFHPSRPKQECTVITQQQFDDFQSVWQTVDPDIALVCLCGNHDVGNRPNKASIDLFTKSFGNDYLGFWVNGTYNIVVNTNLFWDPSNAQDLYREQLTWLQERLEYATDKQASQIFVFGHHPWFLYNEDEEDDTMEGRSPYPQEWGNDGGNDDDDEAAAFPDYYFHVPKQYRQDAMKLLKEHNVTACFSGHFHQNLVSQTEWGMKMIVTASLSMLFESSGKPDSDEAHGRGLRIVTVDTKTNRFHHEFRTI